MSTRGVREEEREEERNQSTWEGGAREVTFVPLWFGLVWHTQTHAHSSLSNQVSQAMHGRSDRLPGWLAVCCVRSGGLTTTAEAGATELWRAGSTLAPIIPPRISHLTSQLPPPTASNDDDMGRLGEF